MLITVIFTLNVFSQNDAEKQGKEINEKYQIALGGKVNLDKIKIVETIYDLEMVGVKKKQTVIQDKVNKKNYSVTEGGIEGKQESGFDGKRNWIKNMSFRGYRDGDMRLQIEAKNHLRLPNETIDGKEYFVLKTEDENINVKTYYDTQTYLLARTETKGEVGGRPILQTNILSDYRKVGDILVPFKQTTVVGQGIAITRIVVSVRHNIEVDPKIFEYSEEDNKTAEKVNYKPSSSTKVEWNKRDPEAIVPEDIKKGTLEKVWSTINNTYFDSTFNGVDWNVIKTKYSSQLGNIKTNQNLTDFLNKMVGELKQSHLKVVPAHVVAINGVIPEDLPKTGSIGLETRLLNNSEVVITGIRKDSPAEKAGLKKGDLIKKVDGETIELIAQKQHEKGGFQLRDELTIPRAVRNKLSGELNKKVSVTFVNENNAEQTVEIERKDFGVVTELDFESKALNADVGYIRFNIFIGDLPKKFGEAIAAMQSKKSVIIDLRGNPGGIGNHTLAIAGMLDKEKRSLGVSQYRYNKQEYNYEGGDKSFKGKIFILIDEMSGSSAEILAAGLQAHKRATVIGRNSAGAVLPSTQEILPNGGVLQYAIGDYKTPDGKVLEGRGVIPDVEVKLTRQDLLTGKDLVLETALNLAK